MVDVRDDGKVSDVLRIHGQFERRNVSVSSVIDR
jgi:hypothetical protein